MRLYLETSVPNFLFVDDAPAERRLTETLFAQIAERRHEARVSELYLDEARRTTNPWLRYQLEGLIDVYELQVVPVTREAEELAQEYIAARAFTEANYADALHVAIAAAAGLEVVVSWNYRHIVRAWTIARVEEVNRRIDRPGVVICTPQEVIEHD